MAETVPVWAMGGANKKTRDELADWLILMARGGIRVPHGFLRTKSDIVQFIEAERRTYWNGRYQNSQTAQKEAPQVKASTAFKGITASECDAWLRTLPVVPLYGEA